MSMDEFDQSTYKAAQRRVQEKAKFYKHLYIYLIICGFFFLVALFRGRPFAPSGVVLFWGLGVLYHYVKVFGIPGSGILSKEWEQREVKKEMERMGKKTTPSSQDEELKLKELRKNYDDSELV